MTSQWRRAEGSMSTTITLVDVDVANLCAGYHTHPAQLPMDEYGSSGVVQLGSGRQICHGSPNARLSWLLASSGEVHIEDIKTFDT